MTSSGLTNSYSTVAVIPQFPMSGRINAAATGLYTVPAGKKAIVKGAMVLDAVGADASYAIAVLRSGTYFPLGPFVVAEEQSAIHSQAVLVAGDILTNIGDSGSTNGTCDIDISVQEVTA